jgi:hypothetical protein
MILEPFPRIPSALAPRLPAGGVQLRRFGEAAADLDVDFDDLRPRVVDQVLSACMVPADAAHLIDRLPVSVRVRALLRLAAVDQASAELVFACGRAGCEAALEVTLPLDRIAADPDQVADQVEVAGRRVRVPTGADQHRVAAGETPAALAGSLLADGEPIGAELVPAIDRALAAADPLVAFFVTTTCPGCGHSLDRDVDLEALALERLARAQAELVAAVHRLATAYHWTEAEVLALPPRRRRWYLALIERGQA